MVFSRFVIEMQKTSFDSIYGRPFSQSNVLEYHDILRSVSRIGLPSGNVSVCNCVFRDCSSGDNGGALYYASSSYMWLLVEDTSFIRCTTTSNYGGAIYFNYKNNNKRSFINRACFFQCSASKTSSSSGQSLYIVIGSDFTNNNYINNSCVTNNYNSYSDSWYAQYIESGRIVIFGENISKNVCSKHSALYVNSCGYSAYISHSSFTNNTSNNFGCIQIGNHLEISESNILFNEQMTQNSPSTLYTSSNLYIVNSCILENNKGKIVFYEASSSYKIELYNCTIDSDIFTSTRYTRNVRIDQANIKDFIHGLEHLNLNLCKASIDSVGTLTPPMVNRKVLLYQTINNNGSALGAFKIARNILINAFLSFD